MPNERTEPVAGESENLLEATLIAFETYISDIADGASKTTKDEENRLLITTNAKSFQSQFLRLTGFTRSHYARLNSGQKEEVDTFLEIQDGVNLASSGSATAKSAFKKGWFKKFLKWALKWIKEIKKVLREIIALILDALGIKFPKWLETIFLLIDELHDALISLLADVFGLDVAKFDSDASRAEVYFLNELYAVERLRSIRDNQSVIDDD